jgi:superfamily II DNA or RNA helicase
MFCLLKNNEFNKEKYLNYILYNNDKNIYLPRNIKELYKDSNITKYVDNSFSPSVIEPYNFVSTLKSEQCDIINSLRDVYDRDGCISGILHIRCGLGKTFLSIYLANLLNKKTIVFVDNDTIAKQWKSEILSHTNLTENDIGLIKADIFDVENKRIIITTPQTFSSKIKRNISNFYKKIKDIGIDLCFYDECHEIGNNYASSLLMLNTKNIIGLTATPYFDKEKGNFIKSVFGNVIIKYTNYDYTPEIKFVKFNSGLGKEYGKRVRFL